MRLTFPKSSRLLHRSHFLYVQKQGKKIDLGPCLALVLSVDTPMKVGFTTSKKVGKAWFRNRVRRLMRDAVRRLLLPERLCFEIVFIAKRHLPLDIKQEQMDQAVLRLLTVLQKSGENRTQQAHPKQQPNQTQEKEGEKK